MESSENEAPCRKEKIQEKDLHLLKLLLSSVSPKARPVELFLRGRTGNVQFNLGANCVTSLCMLFLSFSYRLQPHCACAGRYFRSIRGWSANFSLDWVTGGCGDPWPQSGDYFHGDACSSHPN